MVKKREAATPDRYIVSFLDILGYSNIVSMNDIGRTERLLEAVSEVVDKADEVAERLLNGAKSKGLDRSVIANSLGYRAFSDNIVVFCGMHPESDDQFDNLDNYLAISAVLILQSWIQTTLLSEYGLLSRGGVTIGEFTVRKNFLFGKALVDAYNLEETADTPRIIVDRKVRDTFRTSSDKAGYGMDDWNEDGAFITDTDGEIYIPYLVTGVHIDKMLSEDKCTPSAQQVLERHYNGLRRAIEENEEDIRRNRRIRHKYIWAAGYHNREAKWAGFGKTFNLQELYVMDSPVAKKKWFHRFQRAEDLQ